MRPCRHARLVAAAATVLLQRLLLSLLLWTEPTTIAAHSEPAAVAAGAGLCKPCPAVPMLERPLQLVCSRVCGRSVLPGRPQRCPWAWALSVPPPVHCQGDAQQMVMGVCLLTGRLIAWRGWCARAGCLTTSTVPLPACTQYSLCCSEYQPSHGNTLAVTPRRKELTTRISAAVSRDTPGSSVLDILPAGLSL